MAPLDLDSVFEALSHYMLNCGLHPSGGFAFETMRLSLFFVSIWNCNALLCKLYSTKLHNAMYRSISRVITSITKRTNNLHWPSGWWSRRRSTQIFYHADVLRPTWLLAISKSDDLPYKWQVILKLSNRMTFYICSFNSIFSGAFCIFPS